LTLIPIIILALNIVFAITIVFIERRNPTAAMAWLLVLFLLPPIGFFLYLLIGQNHIREKKFNIKREEDLEYLKELFYGQSSLFSSRDHRFTSTELEEYREIILLLLKNNWSFLTKNNSVKLYTSGEEKFKALFHSIKEAKHHIHLEYFIVKNDSLGKSLITALAEKAREGVEVRLLFDALGTRANGGSPEAFRELPEAGGEIGVFFPTLYQFNYRNHRKIAIFDGTHGMIGGFNIGDDYLGKGPLGEWRDTAILIEGEGARMLQLRFFHDWHFTTEKYPALSLQSAYFPEPISKGDVPLQIVSCGPDTKWSPIKEGFLKLIQSARNSISIQTPYFIPDQSITDALRIAALSGVDVRLMIPCKPDHPFVYWASLSFVGDLLDAGVKAYTYNRGFLHSKTIVVDRKAGSIGSANWDVRSFHLNFEENAFFYDSNLGEELAYAFYKDLQDSTEITQEDYMNRSRWVRFKESVSRLVSPLA